MGATDFKNILIISVKKGEKRAVIYRQYTLYFIDFCKQFRDRLIGINAFAISFPKECPMISLVQASLDPALFISVAKV